MAFYAIVWHSRMFFLIYSRYNCSSDRVFKFPARTITFSDGTITFSNGTITFLIGFLHFLMVQSHFRMVFGIFRQYNFFSGRYKCFSDPADAFPKGFVANQRKSVQAVLSAFTLFITLPLH